MKVLLAALLAANAFAANRAGTSTPRESLSSALESLSPEMQGFALRALNAADSDILDRSLAALSSHDPASDSAPFAGDEELRKAALGALLDSMEGADADLLSKAQRIERVRDALSTARLPQDRRDEAVRRFGKAYEAVYGENDRRIHDASDRTARALIADAVREHAGERVTDAVASPGLSARELGLLRPDLARESPVLVEVRIDERDVLEVKADALITAIDSSFLNNGVGGLDKKIRNLTGMHFYGKVLAAMPTLADGQAYLARGNDKTAASGVKNMIFVIDDSPINGGKKPLREVLLAALREAEKAGFSSVAIPLLRLGAHRGVVETSDAALAEMAEAVKLFKAEGPKRLAKITFSALGDADSAAKLRAHLGVADFGIGARIDAKHLAAEDARWKIIDYHREMPLVRNVVSWISSLTGYGRVGSSVILSAALGLAIAGLLAWHTQGALLAAIALISALMMAVLNLILAANLGSAPLHAYHPAAVAFAGVRSASFDAPREYASPAAPAPAGNPEAERVLQQSLKLEEGSAPLEEKMFWRGVRHIYRENPTFAMWFGDWQDAPRLRAYGLWKLRHAELQRLEAALLRPGELAGLDMKNEVLRRLRDAHRYSFGIEKWITKIGRTQVQRSLAKLGPTVAETEEYLERIRVFHAFDPLYRTAYDKERLAQALGDEEKRGVDAGRIENLKWLVDFHQKYGDENFATDAAVYLRELPYFQRYAKLYPKLVSAADAGSPTIEELRASLERIEARKRDIRKRPQITGAGVTREIQGNHENQLSMGLQLIEMTLRQLIRARSRFPDRASFPGAFASVSFPARD